jgi:hypothetical protein
MWSCVNLLRRIRIAALALLWGAVPLLCGSAQGANELSPYGDARLAFQEAYSHIAANPGDSGSNDGETLKSYPLYP